MPRLKCLLCPRTLLPMTQFVHYFTLHPTWSYLNGLSEVMKWEAILKAWVCIATLCTRR